MDYFPKVRKNLLVTGNSGINFAQVKPFVYYCVYLTEAIELLNFTP